MGLRHHDLTVRTLTFSRRDLDVAQRTVEQVREHLAKKYPDAVVTASCVGRSGDVMFTLLGPTPGWPA